MGEWKAQLSLRVRQALRAELEEFAARERRREYASGLPWSPEVGKERRSFLYGFSARGQQFTPSNKSNTNQESLA